MTAPLSATMISAGLFALVRSQRAAKGLTQADMAHRLGVSLRTFKRWEYSDGSPTLEVGIRWMRALDIVPTFAVSAEGVSSDTSGAQPDDASASSAIVPHRGLFTSSFSEDVAGGRSVHGNSPCADFPNSEAGQ
ncbi:helix-turn-helix transcriptional regulator [Aureimonas sp. D3]|uniref:helix-turn-helix transcriptional regulator n=1 Tax=Aureimonas sp. D3 TaxID=1638164 RepID=UPI000780B330|nr:helix-turn-helix transcriptional regulator [Aureimonas sp. D3]